MLSHCSLGKAFSVGTKVIHSALPHIAIESGLGQGAEVFMQQCRALTPGGDLSFHIPNILIIWTIAIQISASEFYGRYASISTFYTCNIYSGFHTNGAMGLGGSAPCVGMESHTLYLILMKTAIVSFQ